MQLVQNINSISFKFDLFSENFAKNHHL